MEEWNRLVSTYSSERVTFKLVYIQEAHASDGWPMPSSRFQPEGRVVDIARHRSVEERAGAASRLVEEMRMLGEVMVDTLEDVFNTEYAAWPTMFYVIKDGKLTFKGMYIVLLALQMYSLCQVIMKEMYSGAQVCHPGWPHISKKINKAPSIEDNTRHPRKSLFSVTPNVGKARSSSSSPTVG